MTLVLLACGIFVILYALKCYIRRATYTKTTLIDNKIVLITGANTGIGKATAIDLAKRRGKIYIACRDKTRGQAALEDIRKESGNERVYFLQLDLASLKSIREFSENFHRLEKRLDILINNAGLVSHKKLTTDDGFEIHLGVNYLGHFLLTNLLLDLLKAAAPSRIVIVSSFLHKIYKIDKTDLMSSKDYSNFKAYGRSKLACVLFTRELANKLKDSKITINCCHPGGVKTDILRGFSTEFMYLFSLFLLNSPFAKTPLEGAQTQLMLALDPELEEVSGKYFSDCQESNVSNQALNDDLAKWLWEKSCDLVDLKNNEESIF